LRSNGFTGCQQNSFRAALREQFGAIARAPIAKDDTARLK
jgi:hypothetical protein